MLSSQWRACRAVAAALLRLACCVACAAAARATAMNPSYGAALFCLLAGLILVILIVHSSVHVPEPYAC
jgi:uncharacterized membrane protein